MNKKAFVISFLIAVVIFIGQIIYFYAVVDVEQEETTAPEATETVWEPVTQAPNTPDPRAPLPIPEKAKKHGNSYYMIYGNTTCRTWEEAQAYCESMGGHLATISSAAENTIVWSAMMLKRYPNAYIGLSDRDGEGNWVWVTGEKVKYTNWLDGEPDGGARENYAEFRADNAGRTWSDGDFGRDTSSDQKAFVCEWEARCKDETGFYADHDWQAEEVLRAATCQDVGEVRQGCTRCDAERTAELPLTEHRYGRFAVVKGSALIPPIVKERSCEVCAHTTSVTDWSYVWVPIVAVVLLIGIIIGVANYAKAFRRRY